MFKNIFHGLRRALEGVCQHTRTMLNVFCNLIENQGSYHWTGEAGIMLFALFYSRFNSFLEFIFRLKEHQVHVANKREFL